MITLDDAITQAFPGIPQALRDDLNHNLAECYARNIELARNKGLGVRESARANVAPSASNTHARRSP
jgi:hypothetical protein